MSAAARSEGAATAPLRPPPGPGWLSHWLTALFGTWTDRVITLACLALVVIVLPGVANWVFFDAVWW